MAIRIICKTPSTGTVANYTVPNATLAALPANSDVTDIWTTIAEAPDYSVPDARRAFLVRDPADISRAIRPGEVFFMTPIFARNTNDPSVPSNAPIVVEARLALESRTNDSITIDCPGRMTVPAGDTAMIPMQGRSLLKRDALSIYGDRIQIKAYGTGIEIWAAGEIKPSSENTLE